MIFWESSNSFHHRFVFRVTMLIYKIINFSSAPSQLKKMAENILARKWKIRFAFNQKFYQPFRIAKFGGGKTMSGIFDLNYLINKITSAFISSIG